MLFQVSRDAGSLDSIVDSLPQVWGCPYSSSCLDIHLSIQQRRKFLYRNDTKNFKNRGGFTDIPVISKLVERRRQHEWETRNSSGGLSPTVIPRERKMIPWTDALEVLERHRLEADMEICHYVRKNRTSADGLLKVDARTRSDFAIAMRFQFFLILAVWMAMPPGRPRDYRELEYGRTFVQGIWESGMFTSIERMKKPELAKYYIHLMPSDYKTGRAYGEWWGELPNIHYLDGKTLYGYLEDWKTKWRKVFKPNHNCVFTQNSGKPLTDGAIAKKIQYIFLRFTDVPVNGNSLRHMYVTFLKDIKATESQLEAAAYAMRHSRATQVKMYDQQAKNIKLLPILEFNKEFSEGEFAKLEKIDPRKKST